MDFGLYLPPEPVNGRIFDVQHFSVHDGPGIRTTIFLKGCPLRCAWCQNPESQKVEAELAFFADRCAQATGGQSYGQGACPAPCVASCEAEAIHFSPGGKSVELDRERCGVCGDCVAGCGYGAFDIVGQSMTAQALLDKIKGDVPYYRASGGGITISGGEPMLQSAFVAAIVDVCREAGIDVCIQTCGAYPRAAMDPILDRVSRIQFDLKIMEPTAHREFTGADNRTILRNAYDLVRHHAPVEFRRLIVPGVNDTAEELEQLAEFLLGLETPRVTLLQYHSMGDAKLPRLGRPAAVDRATTDQAHTALLNAQAQLQAFGIDVRI